jgi:hypothetical protein
VASPLKSTGLFSPVEFTAMPANPAWCGPPLTVDSPTFT